MACSVGGRCFANIKRVELINFVSSRCYSKYGPTELKGKTTAQRWLIRQQKDPYVKMARQEDYRCRSAFKLLEIDKKYEILKPGHIVIDCGAAPGSWTQVALDKIHERIIFSHPQKIKTDKTKEKIQLSTRGFVIAIDLLDIPPIEGAHLLTKQDFTMKETRDAIKSLLKDQKADVILSDMAPTITGLKFHDHHNSIEQVMMVLQFSLEVMAEGGTLLAKTFQGQDLQRLEENMRKIFREVLWTKPHASRSDSSEIYILGRGFGCRGR